MKKKNKITDVINNKVILHINIKINKGIYYLDITKVRRSLGTIAFVFPRRNENIFNQNMLSLI